MIKIIEYWNNIFNVHNFIFSVRKYLSIGLNTQPFPNKAVMYFYMITFCFVCFLFYLLFWCLVFFFFYLLFTFLSAMLISAFLESPTYSNNREENLISAISARINHQQNHKQTQQINNIINPVLKFGELICET